MIDAFKRVLVLSPHPDDAELGAGGTIARLASGGALVYMMRFSSCAQSLGHEAATQLLVESDGASAALGVAESCLRDFPVRRFAEHRQSILDDLIQVRGSFRPDLVLVHATGDTHQDHEVVRAEAVRAFRRTITLLGYETPWSNQSFRPQVFIPIDRHFADAKVDALACYRTQEHRPYMAADVVRAGMRVRGMQCDHLYAEAFEVIRAVAC